MDALSQLDESGDGVIDFKEFEKWITGSDLSAKGSASTAALKAKILMIQMKHKLNDAKQKKLSVDKADGGLSITVEGASINKVAAFAELQVCTEHVDKEAIRQLNLTLLPSKDEEDEKDNVYITMDVQLKSGAMAKPIIEKMVKSVNQYMCAYFQESEPATSPPLLNVQFVANRVCRITGRCPVQKEAIMIGEFQHLLEGAKMRLELGWTLESLCDPDFTLADLFELTLKVVTGPIPSEILEAVVQQGTAAYEQMEDVDFNGLDVPLLKELKNGEAAMQLLPYVDCIAKFCHGSLADSDYEPMTEKMLQTGLLESAVGEFIKVALYGPSFPECGGGLLGIYSLPEEDIKKFAMCNAFQVQAMVVASVVEEIKGVHVRLSSGFGASVQFDGLIVPEHGVHLANKYLVNNYPKQCEDCETWTFAQRVKCHACPIMCCSKCVEGDIPRCGNCYLPADAEDKKDSQESVQNREIELTLEQARQQDQMKSRILVCGLSGSGKTAFLQQLSKMYGDGKAPETPGAMEQIELNLDGNVFVVCAVDLSEVHKMGLILAGGFVCVLHLVDISAYDQVIDDIHNENHVLKAFFHGQDVANNRHVRHTIFSFVLTKSDLFEEKIAHIPLDSVPSLQGGQCSDKSQLEAMFLDARPARDSKVYWLNTTSSESVDTFFIRVNDTIIRKLLENAALL